MDFQLTEEQKMLKKMVYDVADKEFRPKAAEWEAKAEHMPCEYVRKLAPQGCGMGS